MESIPVTRAAGRPASIPGLSRTVVVVIGRNEGERLRESLSTALATGAPVVYADSGSADGSSGLARSLGCPVIELDPASPMSAARARNEGFEAAMRLRPDAEWIQFLDGDCALADGWLDLGVREIESRPEAVVVCGRLRESKPEASMYNRLCQLEWDRPPGEVLECGGIMLMRASAFRQVGGFDPRIVAGEDPELCLRLRRSG